MKDMSEKASRARSLMEEKDREILKLKELLSKTTLNAVQLDKEQNQIQFVPVVANVERIPPKFEGNGSMGKQNKHLETHSNSFEEEILKYAEV